MTGTGPQAIQFGHRTPPFLKQGLTGLVVAIERDRLRVSDLIGQSCLEMGFAPILEASEITGVLELRDAKAARCLDRGRRLLLLDGQHAHATTSPTTSERR